MKPVRRRNEPSDSELTFSLIIISIVLSVFPSGIGGSFVSISASEAFGNKDFTKNQTFLMASTFIAGALAPLISTAVLKLGGSFRTVNIITAVVALIGAVLLITGLAISPNARKKIEKGKE
ncbi:MAG: hypothetical protein FWH55_03675 [Oscillospiraceae bacterium]|nr:hypothetical protein [Oscillospiraceae bacterium]